MAWEIKTNKNGFGKIINYTFVQKDEKGNVIKEFSQKNDPIFRDGLKHNNLGFLTRGNNEEYIKAMEHFLNKGNLNSREEFMRETGLDISEKGWENIKKDVNTTMNRMGLDPETYDAELGRSKTQEEMEEVSKEEPLNPYAKYLEKQRQKMESAELGLATEQNEIAKQNADIMGQQSMMQQGQLKDQLIEQIKSDRLSKMRSGLTPMQIAQEELQFMVGNQQANAQQMALVNQQRLGATQAQKLTPYQAYLNSTQGVTGGQGYGNIATGFAATDAGDLYQQALRLARSRGKMTPTLDEINTVEGK